MRERERKAERPTGPLNAGSKGRLSQVAKGEGACELGTEGHPQEFSNLKGWGNLSIYQSQQRIES